MGRAVRADKQARAALHHFRKWYADGVENMNFGWYRCHLEDSPLSAARKLTPHSLLYFLLLLTMRLVDQFLKTTASAESYVQHCVATMHKCPPAIIGLLVYLQAPSLSPSIAVSFPATSKQRMLDSGSGRAVSKAASMAQSGSTSAAGAAVVEAATSKPDAATLPRLEIATRYAYSELDQEARRQLTGIDWSWTCRPDDCEDILAAFSEYQRSNDFADRCLNLSAVVIELRLTVQFFSQERLWPRWLLQPNNARLKRIRETHDADVDCGNEMLEVIVNLMNLAGAMESVWHQETCTAAPHVQDGDQTNNSSVQDHNFWGNVLERLLSTLGNKTQNEPREKSVKRGRR